MHITHACSLQHVSTLQTGNNIPTYLWLLVFKLVEKIIMPINVHSLMFRNMVIVVSVGTIVTLVTKLTIGTSTALVTKVTTAITTTSMVTLPSMWPTCKTLLQCIFHVGKVSYFLYFSRTTDVYIVNCFLGLSARASQRTKSPLQRTAV
jgi:hypothetical protein